MDVELTSVFNARVCLLPEVHSRVLRRDRSTWCGISPHLKYIFKNLKYLKEIFFISSTEKKSESWKGG